MGSSLSTISSPAINAAGGLVGSANPTTTVTPSQPAASPSNQLCFLTGTTNEQVCFVKSTVNSTPATNVVGGSLTNLIKPISSLPTNPSFMVGLPNSNIGPNS
jgi:hypothetical protein